MVRGNRDLSSRRSSEGQRPLPAAPDIPAILRTLTEHRVAFIVIGGVAVAHHGYVRATKDVDIVPEPGEANIRRLWDALQELEAQPLSLRDFRPEELPEPFALGGLLKLGNWDLSTKHGRLDILQYLSGKLETAEDHARLAERSETAHFDFGTIRVVGYEDLIDLKGLAGRDQDLIDIRALREARGDIGP